MDLDTIMDGADRFATYVEELTSVIGHADRAAPLRDYCAGPRPLDVGTCVNPIILGKILRGPPVGAAALSIRRSVAGGRPAARAPGLGGAASANCLRCTQVNVFRRAGLVRAA